MRVRREVLPVYGAALFLSMLFCGIRCCHAQRLVTDSPQGPIVSYNADHLPRQIDLAPSESLELSGKVPSNLISSRVVIRRGPKTLASIETDERWRTLLNPKAAGLSSGTIDIVAQLPSGRETALGRFVLHILAADASPGQPPIALDKMTLHVGGGKASMTREQTAYVVHVEEPQSKQPWTIQMTGPLGDLIEGHTYVLRFRARTDTPHDFIVAGHTFIGQKHIFCGLFSEAWVGSQWNWYRYPFIAAQIKPDSRITFDLGISAGKTWLDNVTLEDQGKSAYPALATTDEDPYETVAVEKQGDAANRWPVSLYRTYEDQKSETKRYLIVPVRFADTRDRPVAPQEYYRSYFSKTWPSIPHYWRSVSYGHLNVEGDAAPWLDLPGSWKDYCKTVDGKHWFDYTKLAQAVEARVSLRGYFGLIMATNCRDEGNSAGWGGVLPLARGPFPCCLLPEKHELQIFAHEMGHTLGLNHPAFGPPGGPFTAYMTSWDVMSTSADWAHPNRMIGILPGEISAYQKMRLGWIPERQILRLSRGMDRTVHLERSAEPANDGYLLAVIAPIEGSSHYWTVEARIRSGYDVACIPDQGAIIYDCKATDWGANVGPNRLVLADEKSDIWGKGAAWRPGLTFRNKEQRFSVTVLSIDINGCTVHIVVDP